jgi:4'-phosphopantetheinyl transferase
VVKRRADWRLGRWTAKGAVAARTQGGPGSFPQIEIRAADDGAPEAWIDGRLWGRTLSLSHSGGRAVCAVAAADGPLGCDLERIESRGTVFVEDYFTVEEASWIARQPAEQRDLLVNLAWSAKESALKALRQGLRWDTRTVEVDLGSTFGGRGWLPLEVAAVTVGRRFYGWWLRLDEDVLTVVGDRRGSAPVELEPGSSRSV